MRKSRASGSEEKRGLPCSGQVYPAVIIAGYTGQANDILQFMIQSGIINSDDVQKTIIIETERVATRIPDILKSLKSGV